MRMTVTFLAPLWTGGADVGAWNSFRPSGLIGSLRWWYELTVRALGGYACSPVDRPCTAAKKSRFCAGCHLFGCTGWSRAFKLRVLDHEGRPATDQLKAGRQYAFDFIFQRPAADQELWLLSRLLQNVVGPFCSIGGKMTNKPSELPHKQHERHHQDFGLFTVDKIDGSPGTSYLLEDLMTFVQSYTVPDPSTGEAIDRDNDPDWPRLDQLFSIKAAAGAFSSTWLHRLDIEDLFNGPGACLKGFRGKKSKDIFSFRKDRVWGYCQSNDSRDKIVAFIKERLGEEAGESISGSEVVERLFERGEQDA